MSQFRRNMFAADLTAAVALEDARKAENAEARARAQGNAALVAELTARAKRRGQAEIDWPEYFRNARIN
ncbi:hypothetical protein [Ottowia sp.]|uniref:hypothetical protein n=1 Tax=Ottowia sp. TaxID=1898956 RepID=UPI0025F793F3|nr:hypothetical protein [Ottowia sp.]MBK6616321.1 hypothetical protein [Ottowia sp.]